MYELTLNDNSAGISAIHRKKQRLLAARRTAPDVGVSARRQRVPRPNRNMSSVAGQVHEWEGKTILAYALLCFRHAPPHRLLAWSAAARGYVEVMVGTLRTRVGRATGARGTWITGALLLASALLGGCNHDTTGSAAAPATAMSQPPAATQGIPHVTPTPSPAPATKASVQVSWSAPTANTNGSALTDLAGYRVYYGTSPGSLSQSVDVPRAGAIDYVVQGLKSGTWYFAVTAYTNTGLESTRSSVVSKTIT